MKVWPSFARTLQIHRWAIFFRKKEKRIRKLTKGEGETDEASGNGECSRMDEKDDNDTL